MPAWSSAPALPAFNFTVALFNGDTIASVTQTTAASSAAAVGSYALTPSAAVFSKGTAANYTLTYKAGTVTITKAALTITTTNASKADGAALPAFACTRAGLENCNTITSVTETTTATVASAVGSYPVTPSAAVFGSGAAGNYAITYQAGTLSVTAAALSVTTTNAAMVYGAALPAFAFTSVGLKNGDTISAVTQTTLASPASSVGTYAVTPSLAVFSKGAPGNYAITYLSGTLTISAAALTLTDTNAVMTYGSALPAIAFTSAGLKNGDTVASMTQTTAAGPTASVGAYPVTPSAAVFSTGAAGNYTITYKAATITISKAAVTLTDNNATMVFGSALPAFTFTVALFNSDTIASVTQTTAASSAAAVGSYALTPSAAVFSTGSAANYTITYKAGTVTITKAALTITTTNASKAYGAALPAFAFTSAGLVNGNTITSVTETTTATIASAVGSYPVTPSAAVFGSGAAGNYAITYQAGTLSVTAAALSVTTTNAAMVYGAALPAFAFTSVGLKNGDTISAVTQTTLASPASAVGSYPVTPSLAVFSKGAPGNYAITYLSGTLTISSAALTLTDTNAAMTYGSALPAIAFTSAGLKNGDTVASMTQTTAAGPAASVGAYGVTPSAAVFSKGAATNYAITYKEAATVTISKAAVTLTDNNLSMAYGAAVPVFTFSVALFNGDTIASVTQVCAVSSASPVGAYPVTPSAAVFSVGSAANYTLTYKAGTVTVTGAALTITSGNASMVYGAGVPAVSFSAVGFANGDGISSVTETTTATSLAFVGGYPVTASAPVFSHGSAANYSISYVSGTITITPAPLTITDSNATMSYGAALPAIGFSAVGLKNGDVVASLTQSSPASTANVGTAPVTPSIAVFSHGSAGNYAITYLGATITITPAALTITAGSSSMAYGAAVPALTYSATGLQNGNLIASVSESTTASSSAGAGSYPVSISNAVFGAGSAGNYTITYQAGVITITGATLTITADDASMVTGGPLPAFAASYAGFLGSDGPSALSGTLSFTATFPDQRERAPGTLQRHPGRPQLGQLRHPLRRRRTRGAGPADHRFDRPGRRGRQWRRRALDALSSDGSSLLFTSDAINMPGDSAGVPMVFVRKGGLVTQISQGEGGQAAMSNDANYIAFISPQGTPYSSPFEITVLDRTTGLYSLESVNGNQPADADCTDPLISDSGRYLAFETTSTVLSGASANPNFNRDIILRDRSLHTNQVLSLSLDGQAATGDCQLCALSPDGRYVAFTSTSNQLIAGTTYGGTTQDGGYLYDTQLQTITRIDLTPTGGQPDDGAGYGMAFSSDDQHLVFSSLASNLVPGVTDGVENVYRYDIGQSVGSNITLVSVNALGTQANLACYAPRISGDGRFIGFLADGGAFDPNDTNACTDIYIADMDTSSTDYRHIVRASLSATGAQGDGDVLYEFCMSRDATTLAWYSFADDIAAQEAARRPQRLRDGYLRAAWRGSAADPAWWQWLIAASAGERSVPALFRGAQR